VARANILAQCWTWSAETGIDGHAKIDLDDLDPELISIRPLPSRAALLIRASMPRTAKSVGPDFTLPLSCPARAGSSGL
jgi:hypothetical protein